MPPKFQAFINICVLQFLFFLIASSYIPVTIVLDSYLSDHRMGKCFEPIHDCSYDTKLAEVLNDWQESSSVPTSIYQFVPNQASRFTENMASDRAASNITALLTITFWMVVLNAGFIGGWYVVKKIRK